MVGPKYNLGVVGKNLEILFNGAINKFPKHQVLKIINWKNNTFLSEVGFEPTPSHEDQNLSLAP